MDLIGPLPRTPESFQYVAVFIDLHSRLELVYILKRKTEVERYLLKSIAKLSQHYIRPVTRVICDNVNEYMTKLILRTLGQQSINVDPTRTHSTEENGFAESYNRTLLNRVRATLAAARLLFTRYWDWCALDTGAKYKIQYDISYWI